MSRYLSWRRACIVLLSSAATPIGPASERVQHGPAPGRANLIYHAEARLVARYAAALWGFVTVNSSTSPVPTGQLWVLYAFGKRVNGLKSLSGER
jgi:hypothetical protein